MPLIKISIEEYNYLKSRSFKLNCLEQGGVDNWEGYEDAMDIYDSVMEVVDEYEKL